MSTPAVSIILPTYNRADTLPRALDSVFAQQFEDWELVVVDDGSTDDSADLVAGHRDPRIRLIRQTNAGTYVARNRGLEAAQGRWITFLDSDDAWQPHYLALSTAFLRWAPEQQVVTTEFDHDYGGHVERQDRFQIGHPYLRFARDIGSKGLELPPGETDDYLRIYEAGGPIGPWGADIAAAAGHPDARWYHGHLFRHMRWGYLNWLPVTMLTREAMQAIGPFSTRTRNAADFHYLGRIARQYRINMLAVPGAIKYERALGNRPLSQGHLATGANSYSFEVNKLGYFDELFGPHLPTDAELRLVRCHYELYAGFAALRLGERAKARGHLARASRWKPHLRRAYALRLLARLLPTNGIAAGAVQGTLHAQDLAHRLLIGETSFGDVWRKLVD